MAGPYVIGVDGGTESIRAGVFDLEGTPLAFASSPYTTEFPGPGRAEQDPNDWWAGLGTAVRQAIAEAGVRPDAVAGIGVDTTCCSVVALDDRGDPVRPALIWMDVRADAETRAVLETGDEALIVNSGGAGPVSAEWMVPKALWIATHEPDAFETAATVCEYQDYINRKLTGRRCASINNVSIRWHYRSRAGGFSESLLSGLKLDALMDKWPSDVIPLGEIVGPLTGEAADHLGLHEGLPVAQGGADAFIAMLGLGVVAPGTMAFITGSSHLHLGLSSDEFHGQGVWGTYSDAVMPGLHAVEGGQTSTGSIIAWFKRMLAADVSFDTLNQEAAALPPGSDGLIVQDHFQGNRTPHTDALSRGAFTGLSLAHGRAHLFRAIMEGIAFGTEAILETQRKAGYAPERVVIAGGATRSDLWMQIHADVSNVPLTVTRVSDAPALGSAILAAVGAGVFPSIEDAAAAMVHVDRTIEPNPDAHAAYRPFYQRYKAAYPALKSIATAG